MTLNLEQLNRFHDYLCSQDYYKDFDDEFYLPEIQEKNADQQKDNDLKEIPLTFDNIESYKSIWEALFYLEAKAQIKKAEKEEVSIIRTLFKS